MLPKQARGISRKHVTEPFTQPAAPDCREFVTNHHDHPVFKIYDKNKQSFLSENELRRSRLFLLPAAVRLLAVGRLVLAAVGRRLAVLEAIV